MARLLRWTLAWLLAVALPLQGVSAATMLACGTVPHAHSTPAAHPEAHAHGHGHGDVSSKPHPATGHACSVCASCCVGAAVPPLPVSIGSSPLGSELPPFLAPRPNAFVGDGLERPPKPFLA